MDYGAGSHTGLCNLPKGKFLVIPREVDSTRWGEWFELDRNLSLQEDAPSLTRWTARQKLCLQRFCLNLAQNFQNFQDFQNFNFWEFLRRRADNFHIGQLYVETNWGVRTVSQTLQRQSLEIKSHYCIKIHLWSWGYTKMRVVHYVGSPLIINSYGLYYLVVTWRFGEY